MSNELQAELEQLKAKPKKSGAERARIKSIEKELEKEKKAAQPARTKSNVFATKPTTQIKPLPIRFSSEERTGITELANDIKSDSLEMVITELGREGEINDTKLVRAAVHLLKERSHAEIIQAIKEVKLNMIR